MQSQSLFLVTSADGSGVVAGLPPAADEYGALSRPH